MLPAIPRKKILRKYRSLKPCCRAHILMDPETDVAGSQTCWMDRPSNGLSKPNSEENIGKNCERNEAQMCIAVFVWQNHPVYPFLLLINRDEFHSRPTKPLGWWEGGEILGGRDGLAGGTWLACTRDGKLAFLTNVREVQKLDEAKSRGDLPVRFLQSKKSPMEFAEEVVDEADQYNGFNLILADLCSRRMVYVTNRPKEDKQLVTEVSPGIHVLTNAKLDSPWPKAQRLGDNFRSLLSKHGNDLLVNEMAEGLMTDTIKVEEESLLPHIFPSELEYHLSSIFVEKAPQLGHYGTRSTSALSLKTSGEVSYYERYLENEVWKEGTVIYQINRRDEMK